jgi:Xaa-Pro aminopeptidase
MRHAPIDPALFTENRQRLARLLAPNSIAVVNSNDVLPTNADGSLMIVPQSDLFYLTGIEQEESILLLAPDASDEKLREVLFLRESNEHLVQWEGHKLTKEQATQVSGIKNVKWLSEWRSTFHRLMAEVERVYLNTNEHSRASVDVETREARFVADCLKRYPLHDYRRLARLMNQLRVIKSDREITLLRKAGEITAKGFARAAKFVKPGVTEFEIEAEYLHEFTRNRARFAYTPIIASGANSCVLHYISNEQTCKAGDVLLLDVAASYANYNADLTRTIPVSGKFTKRQKEIYNAVLRVYNASIKNATVGKSHKQWHKDSQLMMNDELLSLGLIKKSDIKKQTDENPASRKYFMHGLGHLLGLDVHDVGFTQEPMAEGWVLTVEPGIYVPKEGIGVRIETDIVVRQGGAEDLMPDVPVQVDEIESLMAGR